LFAKLLEFFDDLLLFDVGAGEQTFKSGGCGAQGMEIGFQNWFTFGGNVKADGLAMPGLRRRDLGRLPSTRPF
jgi:hypothetical protein